MRLDNTAFTMYMRCPKMYYERYEADGNEVQRLRSSDDLRELTQGALPILREREKASLGIELISRSRDGRAFGSRFHELAHERRLGFIHGTKIGDSGVLQRGTGLVHKVLPEPLESECRAVFAAYEQHYLGNDYTYLESERTHTIPLPASEHSLIIKIDAVARFDDWTIGPVDTKTEDKPGYNFREDWAGRTQASLYLWALSRLYPEERVSRLVVDVVTRGSARRGPGFTRLDDISRPQEALDDAIRNVTAACDEIEAARRSGWWKSNMNICKDGWKRCDYYDLHVYGRTAENLRKYQPAEQYLDV